MNSEMHLRPDTTLTSILIMPNKSQRSQTQKNQGNKKQVVSHYSRKSQNHLQSNDSKADDANDINGSNFDQGPLLFNQQILLLSKLGKQNLQSKTKINTYKLSSPMDYTLTEQVGHGSTERPLEKTNSKIGNSKAQQQSVKSNKNDSIPRVNYQIYNNSKQNNKRNPKQDVKVISNLNANGSTVNQAISCQQIFVEDERLSQGHLINIEQSLPYSINSTRQVMSKKAVVQKLGYNQVNTHTSDDNGVCGSVERESEPHQDELHGEQARGELAEDEQNLPYFLKDNNLENQEKLGILDEDINNQIELLDQLQQLNSLDQSMLNDDQIQQFNELVQIKKDLEQSIWNKEKQMLIDEEPIKYFELNSTQGMATRMMQQLNQQQDDTKFFERIRGSDFSASHNNQNCNAIQVGGVSVEIEEAGTMMLESAHLVDHGIVVSNDHSFIHTGNMTNFQQFQTTGADGVQNRQGTSKKRKKSQRPTPQYQDVSKRPTKASKSQTAIKSRARMQAQLAKDDQQVQSNKLMTTLINKTSNLAAQQQPCIVESLEGQVSVKEGIQVVDRLNRKNSGLLNKTLSKQGAFLPKNMTIQKNSQINKKVDQSSSFTGGSRSKSSVNYLKLMKTTSHISTGMNKGKEITPTQEVPMKQAPMVKAPSQFNLNQTQPISKMKLNEHGLDTGSFKVDRRAQLASCSGLIEGTESKPNDNNQDELPLQVDNELENSQQHEKTDIRDLQEQEEDMDIDLILGHYEYQNFTDQLIDSDTPQDHTGQTTVNYFKIQNDQEVLATTQNQMMIGTRQLQDPTNVMANQLRLANADEKVMFKKKLNLKEQTISASNLISGQINQQIPKSKRTLNNSKIQSSKMGGDYGKSYSHNNQNKKQNHFQHYRPSSQADVSQANQYQQNAMGLQWQVGGAELSENARRPYDQQLAAKEPNGSDKKTSGKAINMTQSQNNFTNTLNIAQGNLSQIVGASHVDGKKKSQNLKTSSQLQTKAMQQKMNTQEAKQLMSGDVNGQGQVPSVPTMMSGIRNKFTKNLDQVVQQMPVSQTSQNKKKRSNSRQKQRSLGCTQNALYPNSQGKPQKLSRNNHNEQLVAKREVNRHEKNRKSSMHSQGSQPTSQLLQQLNQTQNQNKKLGSHEWDFEAKNEFVANQDLQQELLQNQQVILLNKQSGINQQKPASSSKLDMMKIAQTNTQNINQKIYDSQGNLIGVPNKQQSNASKGSQKPFDQQNFKNAQIFGKKVKIQKSMKMCQSQNPQRANQQQKVTGSSFQQKSRLSSTENNYRIVTGATGSSQLNETLPQNQGHAQNYQKVMKTLMELCNQTQNMRSKANENYQNEMPGQIKLINDYSSQDNNDNINIQNAIGADNMGGTELLQPPGQFGITQSHNFKNTKQKTSSQNQVRNATLSNSRRTSKVFLSQQSKEDISAGVLNMHHKVLGSLDQQNPGTNNQHTLGSSTGTINCRGMQMRPDSQIGIQNRMQTQPMSKLQSGLTTQLLYDQQARSNSRQQNKDDQNVQQKIVGLNAINKSPNQPNSLMNTSSNLHDFLRNNKLSIISQNHNQGTNGGFGSTYAPGGLGFGQIRTLMKLPTFQSSHMNKATSNIGANRAYKAAQVGGSSYHPCHKSSGNHSSLLGTLKGGLGIMTNLSNNDNNNEHLNESLRDFEMALEQMNGSTGNIDHVLQQTRDYHQKGIMATGTAGGNDSIHTGNDLLSTQKLIGQNKFKQGGPISQMNGQFVEVESGCGTVVNIDTRNNSGIDNLSQQNVRKTKQFVQQSSNMRSKKKTALCQKQQNADQRITSNTQMLQNDQQKYESINMLQNSHLIHELLQENATFQVTGSQPQKQDQSEQLTPYTGSICQSNQANQFIAIPNEFIQDKEELFEDQMALNQQDMEAEYHQDDYDQETEQSYEEGDQEVADAKDQFYQVQKLLLNDVNSFEDMDEGDMQYRHDDTNEQTAYDSEQYTQSDKQKRKNNIVNVGVKPKFREQFNSSNRVGQTNTHGAKAGPVHLIPKQLIIAAKDQINKNKPQIEAIESQENQNVNGNEINEFQNQCNFKDKQFDKNKNSGSINKRSGPARPNAPKASGSQLIKQDEQNSGQAFGAYFQCTGKEMISRGAGKQLQLNQISSNSNLNESSKFSSFVATGQIKPQRLASGIQKEIKLMHPTSLKLAPVNDNCSQESEGHLEKEEGSEYSQNDEEYNMQTAEDINRQRTKDEQPVATHDQSSPLDSGSKLLKRAMRDIKLENNINLRESEKNISAGISATSGMQDQQINQNQMVESPGASQTDGDEQEEQKAQKIGFDDEQVYNDKYYEMNQNQAQQNTLHQPEKKDQKQLKQLFREDIDEKLRDRYPKYMPDTRLNERRQKTKISNSEFSNKNSNTQILIDHNSAYNPSQIGDADDGVSEQKNRVHNYQFGRQIGEGAYAVVRTATSREDNQKYAIKIYDKSKLSDINRQRSVRREVVLLQKMNHPNIVKLIEAFETDSHVYLVMENVTGGSLHSYLKEMINKQLDEEEARRIFQQILIALKYCHSKCIAHRDIKLENVLLDEHKNVKLIDFGFSTCIPNHKKIRMFCGTPSYMAPQIVSKVEYAGPPADIWATGVLLYALLNGCFPFRGQTDDDLYRRIKRGTHHIYNQRVTREYLDILQRCLDVNDDTRPSAKDLLDDPWFSVTDIKQRAYEEEKRQFKAKILAKVPIIKKTNHTICILAQNPTDVLNKGGQNGQDSGQANNQIQQEDEQKNIRSPQDVNQETTATNVDQNQQPYIQRNEEESPCMGQGLQGTQIRNGDNNIGDPNQSSAMITAGANRLTNSNNVLSAQQQHQPYRNICDAQKKPIGENGEATHVFNNQIAADNTSTIGADYKDQIIVQQDSTKNQQQQQQQQLTVGIFEGNLISAGGPSSQAPKTSENYPRTIILNQNQASLLGTKGATGAASGAGAPQIQDGTSSSMINSQQAVYSSATGAGTNQSGAIVLSYGAAVAPQIHVYQLKKKLNHEAYQAYYNTSSATGVTCPQGPNPALTRAGASGSGPSHILQGMSALGPLHLNVQSSPMAGTQNQPNSQNKMIN